MEKNYIPLKREDAFKHLEVGLDTGKFIPLPIEEIERIIDKHYLGFEPLNPLTEQEEAEMRPRLIQGVDRYLNSPGIFRRLCNREVDLQEASDPEIWTDRYSGSSIRHLNEYMSDDFFKMMMEYCREGRNRQGDKIVKSPKGKIKVLEIGTGTGRALTDMKRIDGNIETHGINFAPEFVMYPRHQYHFMNLERMPKEFEESFDYIHSHQCFRYSAYPDVGYANILRALSVGGVAWLDLSIDKNPLGFQEGKKREGEMLRMCNQLIKDRFVKPIMKRPTIEEIVKLRSIPSNYTLRG